jgi:Zn-dependent protease with chaperone function
MFDSGDLQARAPDATVLAEQRIANVISEMAVAANLPAPRLLITDIGCNAAVFGRDEEHATIVVSRALLAHLDRAEMQGIAAHLIGSIANGDMSIGLQAASTLSLFGLTSRLSTVLTDRGAWQPLMRIFIALMWPTKASARRLAEELADPFGAKDTSKVRAPRAQEIDTSTLKGKIEQFRSLLWLPLAGSVVITGFFTALVCLFLLGPLLSLAWRQRKYMADATAVRLTRDPNTLSEALEKMGGADSLIAPWAAHLSVVSPPGARGLMSNSAVPMFPSLDRRLQALGTMGAHLSRAPKKMPLKLLLIITPLFAIVGVLAGIALFLLAWLSIPLTALFMGIPFAIVHLLLRWIGG